VQQVSKTDPVPRWEREASWRRQQVASLGRRSAAAEEAVKSGSPKAAAGESVGRPASQSEGEVGEATGPESVARWPEMSGPPGELAGLPVELAGLEEEAGARPEDP
jgi:hypothetical protein